MIPSTTRIPSSLSKRYVLVFLVYLVWVPLINGQNDTDAIKLRSEGYAVGPAYLVRQMAIEQAQKNAIEKYALSIIPEKYLNHLQPILNKSSAYIKSARILRDETVNDKSTVELEIDLDEESINSDIATCLIPFSTSLPSISVLFLNADISESKHVDYKESKNSSDIVCEKLKNLKFTVEKDNSIQKNLTELILLINQGLEGKKQIALSQEADIFILGINKYEVTQPAPDNQIKKCKCTLTLEIFRTEDGKLVDAFNVLSSVQSKNPEEGMILTAEDCALKSIPKIITCSFLATLVKEEDTKNVYVIFENFDDNTLVKKVVNLLEMITYGCPTEPLSSSKKKIKYKLYYDGPMVHLVDSITNNSELKDKIIIQKVLDRKMYIHPNKGNQ